MGLISYTADALFPQRCVHFLEYSCLLAFCIQKSELFFDFDTRASVLAFPACLLFVRSFCSICTFTHNSRAGALLHFDAPFYPRVSEGNS